MKLRFGRMSALLASLLAAVALVLPGGPAAAKDLQAVSLANTSHGLQLILPQVALKHGFFEKHGLKVTITEVIGDAGSIPALVSGSVDFSIMTSTPALVAESKGANLQMIAPLSTYPEQVVMGNALAKKMHLTEKSPLADKVKALKGQTVAVYDVGGGLQVPVGSAGQRVRHQAERSVGGRCQSLYVDGGSAEPWRDRGHRAGGAVWPGGGKER